MKRNLLISALAAAVLALLVPSCARNMEGEIPGQGLPEGTPITMRLDFGADNLINLDVSTKAEATPADEERIHDLYVMIFCDGTGQDHLAKGTKIYGRYFSYEHLKGTLSELDASTNEGWWVENRTIPNAEHPENNISKTRGAVKISTRVCSDAKLVVIANIDNGICKLGTADSFGNDMLAYLNGIRTWEQFQQTQVKLTQDVVNRKDLFLMLGQPEDVNGNAINVDTGRMIWGTGATNYNSETSDVVTVKLRAVDAKVRFKVRINERNDDGTVKNEYIRAAKAVYWEVDNTPDRCYLFSDYNNSRAPEGTVYFDSEQAYFEGTDGDWYVFSFYMLESRFAAKAPASNYHDREKQIKTITDKTGYGGDSSEHYVENGEWVYALPNAAYVRFDMILTLTSAGVNALGGNVDHALTSDTIYTIHLGDFSHSVDDYNTLRSTCYTYEITIANSGSIFTEVKLDQENQPGQEGYLLLTDDEIVNADCHYEYHSITFTYDEETTPDLFSWYVKTPFTSQVGGGPVKETRIVNGKSYPTYDPHDMDGTLLDYRWVMFGINEVDNTSGYSTHRKAYPGDGSYEESWGPWDATAENTHPELMDISQLIQYIFNETDKERDTGSSDFKMDDALGQKVIRATIFINEYYYEHDPRDESGNPQPDPQLWRQFVNAQPREMHILSKTVQSRDRKSDVIESSHSVIQQSIQTIYNVYSPDLRSIWGCEHLDEIKISDDPNWKYWPTGCTDATVRSGDDKINGRLNSAYIWGLAKKNGTYPDNNIGVREWEHFLKYDVNNSVPELRDDDEQHFRGLAWSCLTRNRDNNGNHQIDEEEVRWYLASTEQLAGIWVGNESLSTSARLYQPSGGEWRAHVVSSTNKLVSWAEEGGGATPIERDWEGSASAYHTWDTEEEATRGESVRCIRNIGTYDDPVKGLTDISYAPVTVEPDTYFTLERHSGKPLNEYDCSVRNGEDNDDYFIFHFNRLNTNSIREYSPGELPYHEQTSPNNRVYVKMVTQPLSLDMPAYSEKLGEINNKVTQKGHNDYCPEGYRFPNHTEWLLMSLYLPGNYLQKGMNGGSYSNVYPSRTYYDRGYYGSLRSDTEPWSTESGKVGWLFSGTGNNAKMHCSPYNETIKRSRCVKDEDQTGVISGKIAIEGQEVYPGDLVPIDFKFTSTASTFTDATLTLWYKKNGFLTPYDLTSQLKTPTGLQYKGTQYVRIPTVADLGLSVNNLPFNEDLEIDGDADDMYIEVEFSNLNDCSGSDRLPVKMVNPLEGVCLITDAFEGNKIFPSDQNAISLNFHTVAHDQHLSGATLKLCYDGREIDVETIPEKVGGEYTTTYTRSTIDIPTLARLTGIDAAVLNAGDKPVTLKATVSTTYNNTRANGTETLTKVFTQPLTLSNPVIANYFTIADAVSSKVYPGDNNHVDFSFQSRGHNGVLSAVSLMLMNGDNVVADYSSLLTQPSTDIFTVSNLGIVIPSLSAGSLALENELRLVATVSNSDGLSKTLDIPGLVLSNPVSGSISASGSYLYPAGSEESVTFAFQSDANSVNLSSATLTLEFTPPGGSLQQRNITLNTSPNSKTYSPTQAIAVPTIHDLGLTAADLPLSATLHAVVAVADGLSAESSTAVTIKSHYGGTVEILDGFDPSNGFPITIDASSVTGFPIQNVKLRWKQQGDLSYTEDTISIPAGEQSLTSNTITAYWYPSWLNNTTDVVGCVNGVNDATRTYYFTAVVGSSDANGAVDEGLIGLNAAVDEATMEFFKINYNPCPGNWTWQNKPPNTSAYRWPAQEVSNMYFASGDFIDAYLDVSNCTYDPKNPPTVDGTNDLGMDNLITFGPSAQTEQSKPSLNWTGGNVLFYYPARNGSNNNLQIAVVHATGNPGSISRVQPFDLPQDRLRITLKRDLVNDKGVVLVNNYSPNAEHEPDWLNEETRSYTDDKLASIVANTQTRLNNLTASNRQTVYVASTEGQHRSRALYKYVRVVRKHN